MLKGFSTNYRDWRTETKSDQFETVHEIHAIQTRIFLATNDKRVQKKGQA